MSGVTLRTCSCLSEYQDAHYGKGKRLHNVGDKFVSCTVCGDRKPA